MDFKRMNKKFSEYLDIFELTESIKTLMRFLNVDYERKPGTTQQFFNLTHSDDYISVFVNNFSNPKKISVKYHEWDEQDEMFTSYQKESIMDLMDHIIHQEIHLFKEELSKKVKCDKCSWEWKIEPEDEDPYLCHTCGYDNSEMTYRMDKLQKWKEKVRNKYIKEYNQFINDGESF